MYHMKFWRQWNGACFSSVCTVQDKNLGGFHSFELLSVAMWAIWRWKVNPLTFRYTSMICSCDGHTRFGKLELVRYCVEEQTSQNSCSTCINMNCYFHKCCKSQPEFVSLSIICFNLTRCKIEFLFVNALVSAKKLKPSNINTGSSEKMDGIWNRYNLKSTGRIYTFGVLKCSEKFKVLDLP